MLPELSVQRKWRYHQAQAESYKQGEKDSKPAKKDSDKKGSEKKESKKPAGEKSSSKSDKPAKSKSSDKKK